MRDLNYHHLLYFWTVARTGSISAASRELLVSQPAISTQIKALEASLGAPLFAKAGRGLELTVAGRTAYAYAEQIFRLGRELREVIEAGALEPRLRIGLGQMTPALLVDRLLGSALGTSHGKPVTACRVGPSGALLSMLNARTVDVVFAEDEPGLEGLDGAGEPIQKVPYAFFAKPGLVAPAIPFPRSLHGARVLLPAPGTGVRARLAAWFREQGVRPEIALETDGGSTLIECARMGMGVVAAPAELGRRLEVQAGLERLGDAEGVFAELSLHTAPELRDHPALAELLRPRTLPPAPPRMLSAG